MVFSRCSLSRKRSSGMESTATIRTKVFVWGLNDKDQLGGLKGSKVSHVKTHLHPYLHVGDV